MAIALPAGEQETLLSPIGILKGFNGFAERCRQVFSPTFKTNLRSENCEFYSEAIRSMTPATLQEIVESLLEENDEA